MCMNVRARVGVTMNILSDEKRERFPRAILCIESRARETHVALAVNKKIIRRVLRATSVQ